MPVFWRVPTDNDEGGGNSSYAHLWREAGLNSPAIMPLEIKAELIRPQVARVVLKNKIQFKKKPAL